MKRYFVLLLGVVVLLFAAAGCSPKNTGNFYPRSQVSTLKTKTNELQDYQVKYNMKQQVTIREDQTDSVCYETVYEISDGDFRKHDAASYQQIEFTGRITKRKVKYGEKEENLIADNFSKTFRHYTTEKGSFLQYDGVFFDNTEATGNVYTKADKLPSAFTTEKYINVIAIWDMRHGGKTNYVIDYLFAEDEDKTEDVLDNAKRLWRAPTGSYSYPSYVDTPLVNYVSPLTSEVKQCKAEIILNKDGYIVEEIVTLEIALSGSKDKTVDGEKKTVNVNGTATLSLRAEYIKPGKTVEI